MTRDRIGSGALVIALATLALVLVVRGVVLERVVQRAAATPPATTPSNRPAAPAHASAFLYGRITTVDGDTYEGRLRWGGDQEAFWGDYFNGVRDENPWAVHAPSAGATTRNRIEIFGFEIGGNRSAGLNRMFMARFGDIARVDAHVAEVQVTLKSGTVFTLDRFAAGDIDDGVRVWDGRRGGVDLDARRIRTIEFLPTAPLADAPARLHGVVRTPQGDFTGFVQWNQQDGAGSDTLDGRSDDGEQSLRYDTIRSIGRHSRDSVLVTLLDGREVVLSSTSDVGRGNRGIYVDDVRYGRVLVLWDAFERVEFDSGGSGPAYGDFPPGRPLAGSVSTRDGRRLAGRLVYDFDESETTETLDGSFKRVDYAIPFGLIASIIPPSRDPRSAEPGRVVLRGGEEVPLERSGDFGEQNAGVLIVVAGQKRPEYVPWTGIERIDFDPPGEGLLRPPGRHQAD